MESKAEAKEEAAAKDACSGAKGSEAKGAKGGGEQSRVDDTLIRRAVAEVYDTMQHSLEVRSPLAAHLYFSPNLRANRRFSFKTAVLTLLARNIR